MTEVCPYLAKVNVAEECEFEALLGRLPRAEDCLACLARMVALARDKAAAAERMRARVEEMFVWRGDKLSAMLALLRERPMTTAELARAVRVPVKDAEKMLLALSPGVVRAKPRGRGYRWRLAER